MKASQTWMDAISGQGRSRNPYMQGPWTVSGRNSDDCHIGTHVCQIFEDHEGIDRFASHEKDSSFLHFPARGLSPPSFSLRSKFAEWSLQRVKMLTSKYSARAAGFSTSGGGRTCTHFQHQLLIPLHIQFAAKAIFPQLEPSRHRKLQWLA